MESGTKLHDPRDHLFELTPEMMQQMKNIKTVSVSLLSVFQALCIMFEMRPELNNIYKLLRDPKLLDKMMKVDIYELTLIQVK